MKRSIFEYFLENGKGLEAFHNDCHVLHEPLAPTGAAEDASGPPASSKNIDQHDHSEHNAALFEVLQEHCACVLDAHCSASDSSDLVWHPARLCLEGTSTSAASFGLFISSLDMEHWQELRLSMYEVL
jgi:hypothetical protein